MVVITGKDKGKKGEVLKVMPAENRVIVKGVNMVKRHQRQTAAQDGGIISKEGADPSVQSRAEDPKDGEPTRVGFKFLKDGRKVRFAKRSVRSSMAERKNAHTRRRLQAALSDACCKSELVKKFGYKNTMQVPRLDKIVLNMGAGEGVNDSKKVTAPQTISA